MYEGTTTEVTPAERWAAVRRVITKTVWVVLAALVLAVIATAVQ
jgi:hypothetical protein